MFSLKTIFYGLFGRQYQKRDSYKDETGKGLYQRIHEVFGLEFDENTLPYIEDLTENVSNPQTALLKFIPYLENLPGSPYIISDEITRRKLVQYSIRFGRLRGTKRGIRLLFTVFLGFDIVITEIFPAFTFDQVGIKFDDGLWKFDQTKCLMYCSPYTIELTGDDELTNEQFEAIFNILDYNNPINAKLTLVTYNGDQIIREVIEIEIDANGDLNYTNQYDPSLTLSIDANGDLIITSDFQSRYSIDANGDLIYTII